MKSSVAPMLNKNSVRATWYWKSNKDPWSQKEPPEWTPYSNIESQILEEAYKTNKEKVELNNDYSVSFKTNVQYRETDPYRQRPVKRVEIQQEAIIRQERFCVDYRPIPVKDFNILPSLINFDYISMDLIRIVESAAQGIIQEGIALGKKGEAKWMADKLLESLELESDEEFVNNTLEVRNKWVKCKDNIKKLSKILEESRSIIKMCKEKLDKLKHSLKYDEGIKDWEENLNKAYEWHHKILCDIKQQEAIILGLGKKNSWHKATICCAKLFSKESFLHKSVNKALAENDLSKAAKFGPFCFLLIGFIVEGNEKRHIDSSYCLYTGCNLNEDMINQYQNLANQEGNIFYWNSFISTTRKREIAEKIGNALFLIRNSFENMNPNNEDQKRINGADIAYLSDFPSEEEVLLHPCQQYSVDRFEESNGKFLIYVSIKDHNCKESHIPFIARNQSYEKLQDFGLIIREEK